MNVEANAWQGCPQLSLITIELRNDSLGTGASSDDFWRRIVDTMSDGVYLVDMQRKITYWNKGASDISGYSAEEVIGRACQNNLLIHTDKNGCQLCLHGCPLTATFGDKVGRVMDVFLKHRNGHRVPVSVRTSPITDANGRVTGGVEVFRENSAQIAALEKAVEMEQLALIDPLTLVGNRRYTEKVLQERCDNFNRRGEKVVVLFADIDRFKAVNDTHGHDAGDAVLKVVARTLANNLRSFDFLGRWGGEEFVAILTNVDAARAAERCCALVRSCRLDWGGKVIQPTISIGAAVCQPGESPVALIARADAHLYMAKQTGRDRSCGP